jgi:hypothetical protein
LSGILALLLHGSHRFSQGPVSQEASSGLNLETNVSSLVTTE